MTASNSPQVTTEDDAVVVERVFDAPPELVWRAWTEPEHFARWYGPTGFTLPVCEIDLRVGGRHVWGMRSPDGQEMFSTGVFSEIVPLERLVTTDAMADADGKPLDMGGGHPMETTVTVTLEDLGGGRTKLTVRQARWPDPGMAAGAGGGWSQAFEKLAEALPEIAA